MRKEYLVALDQGTTSTRSIVFDSATLEPLSTSQFELPQHYPRAGWVEHDPEDIWNDVKKVLKAAGDYATAQGGTIKALGITNQRETVVLWDKQSGKPLHHAIVWQDRRTADRCTQLRDEGHMALINDKTGLVLDPYFSATKIAWLLEHTNSAAQAARGEVLVGTIDTFLIWRLTAGKVFATDVTNASRTQLFSLADLDWDDELLELHGVPRACLPQVKDCADDFGSTDLLGGSVAICGVAGDQQAAAIGQACLAPGATKSTYGTGCFVIVQGTDRPLIPSGGLLGTVGYRVGGRLAYAAEGSIFIAGAAMQWLRDKLGLFADVTTTAELAAQAKSSDGVYFVPAFTGLGAPHWQPAARGTIVGMTLATDRATLVRAAFAAVAHQTADLIEVFATQGAKPEMFNIDGGMARNDWFVQHLADITGKEINRPHNIETTAVGAAFLAGLQVGTYASLDDITALRHVDRVFTPQMSVTELNKQLAGWRQAVQLTLGHAAGTSG